MTFNKSNYFSVLVSSVIFAGSLALANTDSDNTEVNRRDRAADEVTADQQSMTGTDIEITRRIRQDLVKDKNLSTYAQNVKIITVDGRVTLKGPVRSTNDGNRILKCARKVAGASKVVNQLEVSPTETN